MKEVRFALSAFRHGYTEEDFFGVLAGPYLKIQSERGLDDVYELLGQNLAGEYLHLIYRIISDGSLRVFHISRMSDKQRRRFQRVKS